MLRKGVGRHPSSIATPPRRLAHRSAMPTAIAPCAPSASAGAERAQRFLRQGVRVIEHVRAHKRERKLPGLSGRESTCGLNRRSLHETGAAHVPHTCPESRTELEAFYNGLAHARIVTPKHGDRVLECSTGLLASSLLGSYSASAPASPSSAHQRRSRPAQLAPLGRDQQAAVLCGARSRSMLGRELDAFSCSRSSSFVEPVH